MMTFAQTWEHQEQVRHRSLLQQLKAELTTSERAIAVLYSPAPTASSSYTAPRPKINKTPREAQKRIQSVAIR